MKDNCGSFDRFIVATALTFGAPQITQDQAITQSGLIPVIWGRPAADAHSIR